MALNPTSEVKKRTSEVGNRSKKVKNRTSEVKRRTSRQEDPTSLVQQRTSPQERCTSEARVRTVMQEHWTMEVGDEGCYQRLVFFHQALQAGGLKSRRAGHSRSDGTALLPQHKKAKPLAWLR